MRILYLDTSSSFLYCGLFDDNYSIFEINELLGKRMSEEVLFLINKKFEKNNISTDSVDKIILVNGPGSFTGVRIGITIAKIYSLSLKIPVITISSLYAMALSSNSSFIRVPIIDARRGFVYSGVYDSNGTIVLNDSYISFDSLKKFLDNLNKDYVFISNDSFNLTTENYNPNIFKIVQSCKDLQPTETHLINANYLKATEAEEKNAS